MTVFRSARRPTVCRESTSPHTRWHSADGRSLSLPRGVAGCGVADGAVGAYVALITSDCGAMRSLNIKWP